MLSELRFAFRTLARNRSFTLVTVLTLALGIGSAAAIFSVTDWILFRSSDFPEDLYEIGGSTKDFPFFPNLMDHRLRGYEAQTDALADIAKTAQMSGNVVVKGQPVETNWLGVSQNFFSLLGITLAQGRAFLPEEQVEGADQVVIISDAFRRQHLGGDKDVLGRQVTVGKDICTVVGVLREGQSLPPYFWGNVFRPLVYRVDPKQPWMPMLYAFGRLRPGVSRELATKMLDGAKFEVPAMLRGNPNEEHAALATFREVTQSWRIEVYWVMLGGVSFLYAIACLNASNLVLVRMLGQRRELCIRLALGGGRWRIIRLLAIESVMLAVLGSLMGLLVANWIFPLLLSVAGGAGTAVSWGNWNLNSRVLAVMCGLTVLTSGLIVLIPAVRILRAEIYAGLKDGGASLGESPALARLRGGFVILQAAFAVVLLAGAGLMIRTFQQLQKVDLGFDPTGRAKVIIGFPLDYPNEGQARLTRLREIQAELRRVAGVREVGFGSDLLLPGYYYAGQTLEGRDGKPLKVAMAMFGIGYQDASGLKLKRGRWLDKSTGNEIMVNEALARARWPGEEPVGQLLRTVEPNRGAGPDWKGWLVVGVVGDVRATLREVPGPYLYGPELWGAQGMNVFIVHLSGDYTEAIAGTIRRKLYAFDSQIIVLQTQPLSFFRDQQLWAERLANSVLKVLAGIALLLTVVGIFSVLAYTVDRRMGEFGVRMALGATRGDLLRLVMRRGVLLTAIGIVVGIGGALALTRSLQSLLYETSAQNPAVLVGVGALLLGASVLGCLLPALRATKVDVTRLLRSE